MTLGADALSLLILVGATGLAGVVILRQCPKVAICLWLTALVLLPSWLAIPFLASLQPASLVGALVCVAMLPVTPGRLILGDFVVPAVFVTCLAAFLMAPENVDAPVRVLTLWVVGYVLGRSAAERLSYEWIAKALAVAFTAVAVGALLEFATQTNPFHKLTAGNNAYETWGQEAFRGGLPRVEGAFGHPLALGACIALVLPLVAACGYRFRVRLAMILVMLASVVLTFSRAALFCSVVGLLLTMLTRRSGLSAAQLKASLLSLAAAAAVTGPWLLGVFRAAGQEATESGEYRTQLLQIAPSINILGLADSYDKAPNGDVRFGAFKSIDNAALLIGLTYGLLPLLLAAALYVYAGLEVARLRATPTVTALVAHLPALLTVAFITQYTVFFWFVVGMAVAQQAQLSEKIPSTSPSCRTRRDSRTRRGANRQHLAR